MKLLCSSLLWLGLCTVIFADTLVTLPQGAVMALAKALEHYEEANEGQLPEKLSNLDPYLVNSLERQLGGGPLDESVMLVKGRDIEMVSPNKNTVFKGGEIIAVTTSSIGEDRREGAGRYVIWNTPDGKFRTAWLNESVVEAQFAKAGVALPSGPFLQQPSTLEASPDYVMRKYAEENFKDSKNPTAEEIEKMKQDFAERYGDRSATAAQPTKSETPNSASATSQTSATKETHASIEAKPPSSFPIVPTTIIAVLIIGAVLFFLRRKFL